MIVLIWVMFLFAPGLPILIVITALGLVILYITNKVALAYFCIRPKEYNEKVMQSVIDLLKYSPILYIGMGAWAYSNQ